MKLLFDTHTFLWWDFEIAKLSPTMIDTLRDPDNILFLSVISAWEIQVKVSIGKLHLPDPLEEMIKDHQEANNLQILSVELPHTFMLDKLPFHHKDPFDRMLVAQALVEDLTLVTYDDILKQYSVKTIW